MPPDTTLVHQELPSTLEAVTAFADACIQKLQKAGIDQDKLFSIKLALGEALANAVKHGNRFDPALTVTVSIERREDALQISVRDQGSGFDSAVVPDPTHPENLLKTSGRGIFLIRSIMDRVEFLDCGRQVKMVKLLNHRED